MRVSLGMLRRALGGMASVAAVRDRYAGTAMARFLSTLTLVTGLAPILAPVVGGQLLRLMSWRGVFVVLTAIGQQRINRARASLAARGISFGPQLARGFAGASFTARF